MSQVLIADKQGTPKDWVSHDVAVNYYVNNKVVWEIGTPIKTFYGGYNKQGEQSTLTVSSIIGVSGPILGSKFYDRETKYTERMVLYARDRHLCAYCGDQFPWRELTIDHVHPKSRGGKNTWTNTVAACKPCNLRKGNRTPEEARMHLLFVPYAVNVFERMILQNRNILADQMDFLIGRVPKHSRLLQN